MAFLALLLLLASAVAAAPALPEERDEDALFDESATVNPLALVPSVCHDGSVDIASLTLGAADGDIVLRASFRDLDSAGITCGDALFARTSQVWIFILERACEPACGVDALSCSWACLNAGSFEIERERGAGPYWRTSFRSDGGSCPLTLAVEQDALVVRFPAVSEPGVCWGEYDLRGASLRPTVAARSWAEGDRWLFDEHEGRRGTIPS